MKNFFNFIVNASLSLLLMFFSIFLSVTLVLNFRPLYHNSIERYGLVGKNGLTYEQIKENYDALIEYNSFFGTESLSFPHLTSSENGLFHFYEVKLIFSGIQIALILCLVAIAVLAVIEHKFYKTRNYLFFGGLLTIFVPLTLIALIYINFSRVFVLFHKLMFDNDYWIFSAEKDPIITFLPEQFFMEAAIAVIGIMLLCGGIFLLLYKKLHK